MISFKIFQLKFVNKNYSENNERNEPRKNTVIFYYDDSSNKVDEEKKKRKNHKSICEIIKCLYMQYVVHSNAFECKNELIRLK